MIDSSEIPEKHEPCASTANEKPLTERELRNIRLEAIKRWQRVGIRLVLEGKVDPEEFANDNARTILVKETLLERAKSRQIKAKIAAETDSLTNLANRAAFDRRYKELINKKSLFGLLIVDVNGLKEINDNQGHKAGDTAIYQTGFTLNSGLRLLREEPDNDLVARYGGDEFVILLPNVVNAVNLENIANKLRSKFQSKDENAPPTISIGGGVYQGDMDPESFFNLVDAAQYQAKQAGRKGETRESRVVLMEHRKLK
ncbi:hypothetical protein A3A48_04240 [Candidatus Curtissbacteria bacterium RIFCSPLOWO2_01_FULL_37_9]|uniref:GGDEF domain-containing protein n=1 Tax=Candidatus Curtissbacteria bacterium RIFCSPLOWO2_01_FULL_37_9 TaxID=1797724 RepID=A0A1F5GTH5_9BACT|nr:MAG: hypothetical protein A3A48_04240 [Candidatus Curtissbacteria bacterium RIFCSPLOWO2_01_FULL_37_9]